METSLEQVNIKATRGEGLGLLAEKRISAKRSLIETI
jgi:2C-methyl-D-erythritol 2,4-cyclodiphosphate synthase